MTVPSPVLAATVAAVLCCALTPLVARYAIRLGVVSHPHKDRWHQSPTPILGGVAIAASTILAALLFSRDTATEPWLIGTAVGGFVLGLVDDRLVLGPAAKLVGSLALGALFVFGVNLSSPLVLPAPVIVGAVVWFAAVVHAVNLLDNMDGLAAGVGAITSLAMALVAVEAGANGPVVLLVALTGALLGFLPWNAHPARTFMGDSGSLFIGSVLAGGSLDVWFADPAPTPYVLLAVGIALSVPLGEVVFVSTLRWMAGRRATRGGTDHTSHRLVALGFSERRSVTFLYFVAFGAAVMSTWLVRAGSAALPAAAILLVGVVLGALYLAFVPSYDGEDFATLDRLPFGAKLRAALARSHAAQILLDLVLITACYYAAYRLRFGGVALDIFLPSFAASLPIVIVCKLGAHYASGLYKRSWLTFGVQDSAPVFRAILAGTMLSVLAVTYLYRFERFSRGVFVIDAVLLLLAVLATRLSFRVMSHAAVVQGSRGRRVLILGAGERGQMLAREILLNREWGLKPVGFVASTDAPGEESILGLTVYREQALVEALLQLRVQEVVFSGDPIEPLERNLAERICAELDITIRELIFEIRHVGASRNDSSAA